jgi:fluoroquinolone transport system permease protein
MSSAEVVSALLRKDARVVYRDRFMLMMLCYPIVLAIVLRYIVPIIPVENIALYLAPMPVLFSGMLIGVVFGFALIEERENRTWLLLRVLPITQRGLFLYLVLVTAGLSLPLSLLGAVLYGLPAERPLAFVVTAAVAGLVAPVLMLAMGGVASNKIEGLAVSKVISFFGWVPALVFVLSPAWQATLVWNPYYWIYLGLLHAYAGPERMHDLAIHWPGYGVPLLLTAPALLCLGAAFALARLYRRKAT